MFYYHFPIRRRMLRSILTFLLPFFLFITPVFAGDSKTGKNLKKFNQIVVLADETIYRYVDVFIIDDVVVISDQYGATRVLDKNEIKFITRTNAIEPNSNKIKDFELYGESYRGPGLALRSAILPGWGQYHLNPSDPVWARAGLGFLFAVYYLEFQLSELRNARNELKTTERYINMFSIRGVSLTRSNNGSQNDTITLLDKRTSDEENVWEKKADVRAAAIILAGVYIIQVAHAYFSAPVLPGKVGINARSSIPSRDTLTPSFHISVVPDHARFTGTTSNKSLRTGFTCKFRF